MIEARPVKPEELTHEELSFIVLYAQKGWNQFPPSDLIFRCHTGSACIYRLSETVNGIFVLAFVDGVFYLETVAGAGSVKHFQEIHDLVRETVRGLGGKELYGYVSRPALERLYRGKAEKVATLYREIL